MLKSVKKALISTVAIVAMATLAGCGQKQSAAPTPATSSSAKVTTESASVKAYKAANSLIKKGEYRAALNRLEAVSSPSTKVKNLINDLQNYLDARDSYNQGDYYSANKKLTTQSNSNEMQSAVNNLQSRISSASTDSSANSSADNSSTTATSSATNDTNSSSTTPANAKAASETSDNVVTNFAQKMGFGGKDGYEIIPQGQDGSNTYRLEVRQNNADNTVGHLVGIYTYNSKTGTVTQMQ